MSFKDHFSAVAGGYARSRPRYPEALFDWLASESPARNAAWDAGCGNGQASTALGERFARVVATDPSAAQIEAAAPHPRVAYRVAAAEEGPGGTGFDLVSVAQALHWFDLSRFFDAVRACAVPGALFCAYSYGPLRADDPSVAALLEAFYRECHERGWWPKERRLVDEGYASIAFPFAPVAAPPFAMELDWDLGALLDYIDTWSAVTRLRAAGAGARREELRAALSEAWGDPARPRHVCWPLTVRAGRV